MEVEQMSSSETWGNEWDRTLVSHRRRITQGRARSSLLWDSYLGQYFEKKHSILFCNIALAEQQDKVGTMCSCADKDGCESTPVIC